jgi:hypothetical protein
MANTTQAQISNIFNLMVQLEPRLNFYHFGWRSDILRNIDNNFDQGVKTGRLFPAVHFAVPEYTQFVDALQYESLKEEVEVTLYFDNLQDYNNTGATNTLNLLEQWDYLKSIAEDFVINLNFVLEHYNAGFISLPKFEQFSHGHNDRLISWKVSFKLTHYIECTEAQNQIDTSLLPATIEETDLENYKSQGPPPDRCTTILGMLTAEDICSCVLPSIDFDLYYNCLTPEQVEQLQQLVPSGGFELSHSFNFNGVNSYIRIPTIYNDGAYKLEWLDPLTITATIKISTYHNGAIYSKKNHTGFQSGFEFRTTSEGKLFTSFVRKINQQWLRVQTVELLPLNEWVHVAVSYDGSANANNIKLFINGVQATNDILSNILGGPMFITGGTANIGSRNALTTFLNGKMSTFRFWTIEQSASFIEDDYNLGIPKAPNDTANAIGLPLFGPCALWDYNQLNWRLKDESDLNVQSFQSVNMLISDRTTDIPT